jgi:SAM-dependent methyltransferase
VIQGGDVFGRALFEWAKGDPVPEIVERDDGYTEIGAGPEVYLSEFKEWPPAERQSMRYVRGRVLDVGCGAGRVTLELQRRGFDVVGLDSSALAAKASKLRGVKEVWRAPIEDLGPRLNDFDTLVLFGNNFGIFATPERARTLLTQWATSTGPTTRVLLESTNAYGGGAPGVDRRYYRRNRDEGRMPGHLRLRYHYRDEVSDWFSWLFVSQTEMRRIVKGTGWRVARVVGSRVSEPYVAVLEKL